MMLRRRVRAVAWSILLAAVLGSGASVADESKDTKDTKEDPKKEAEDGPPTPYDAATSRSRPAPDDVITNEDLEQMEETPPGQMPSWVGADAPEPPPQPKPRIVPRPKQPRAARPGTGRTAPVARKPQAALRSPKTQNEVDAERKVAALEARVADLERAVLAARNPRLPREWTRPASDRGTVATGLEQREAQLRQAREELSGARQDLARWRGEEP